MCVCARGQPTGGQLTSGHCGVRMSLCELSSGEVQAWTSSGGVAEECGGEDDSLVGQAAVTAKL
jgi:hypothetical protein